MRLFKEDPKWTPLQRGSETDENQFRRDYLKTRDGELGSVPEPQRDGELDSVPDAQRMT